MSEIQIVSSVTIVLTVVSGAAATIIAVFGDTWRNAGQRNVAAKFAQIALLGAAEINSILALPNAAGL